MAEFLERPDGPKIELAPPIAVNNKYDVQCTHMVAIDGIPLEIVTALRYLLADRERIRTLRADAKSQGQ